MLERRLQLFSNMKTFTSFQLSTQNHLKKFNPLVEIQKKNGSSQKNNHGTVVNLSSYHPSSDEISLLSQGLNIAVGPKRIPTEEIVCGVD